MKKLNIEIPKEVKEHYCKYHEENCYMCPYGHKENFGIWCRVEGVWIIKPQAQIISNK